MSVEEKIHCDQRDEAVVLVVRHYTNLNSLGVPPWFATAWSKNGKLTRPEHRLINSQEIFSPRADGFSNTRGSGSDKVKLLPQQSDQKGASRSKPINIFSKFCSFMRTVCGCGT